MKRIIYLIFLLTLSKNVNCQYWANFQGGAGNDGAGDIATTQSGEVVTANWFSGNLGVNSQFFFTNGGTDILISKTSASGAYLWVTHLGGGGDDRPLAICVDNLGNTYVGGYFSGTLITGSSSITAIGAQDAFVAKLDASGNVTWIKSGGGIYNDAVAALTCDASGNVFCAGNFTDQATFDLISFSSMPDPITSIPSQDVFFGGYDSNGILSWMKKGGGKYLDLAAGICADQSGDVYITGQFSDTITFDNQHDNALLNAGFIVRYSAAGSEVWFNKAGGGSLVNVRGITTNGTNAVYLTGEAIGNTVFFGSPSVTTSNTYLNRVFITKYDLNGNPVWAETDGSDSPVSGSGIAIDQNGSLYIAGKFKCKFSEYADQYGQATFNSVGFNDIFVSKYDSNGTRLWSRSAGGPQADELNGIAVLNVDSPVVCGSYSKRFSFPVNTATFITTGLQSFDVGSPATNCGDLNYNKYFGKHSVGGTDIIFGKFFALDRLPYNFFAITGNPCTPDPVSACISLSSNDKVCQPPGAPGCGAKYIFAATNTCSGSNLLNSAGPDFNYLWSTGDIIRFAYANISGTYTATITSVDGCLSTTDSMQVIINQYPTQPTITDSKGFNINSSSTTQIVFCAPDSVTLTATNVMPGVIVRWVIAGDTTYNDSVTYVGNSAALINAAVHFISPEGCILGNFVRIQVLAGIPLDTISPYINLPDTVRNCGQPIEVDIVDSLSGPCPITQGSVHWTITPATGFSGVVCILNQRIQFIPSVSGMYVVQALVIRTSNCSMIGDTFNLSDSVYVEIRPMPVVNASVTGQPVTTICNAATMQFTATGGGTYAWSNGSTDSTITISGPGLYCVTVSVDSNGCTASQSICREVIVSVTPPVISSTTLNAELCPGDSVILFVSSPGIAYSWNGPGLINNTNDTIYATLPGDYYCNVTNPDSCTLISNLIEVVQFTSPFINVTPSTVFCAGDIVTLEIGTFSSALIQWDPPLSGNSPVQFIQQGGQYSCSIEVCGIITRDTVSLLGITVNPYIAQQDTIICYPDSLTLIPTGFSGSLLWIPDSVPGNQFTVTHSGSFYAVATDVNGCVGNTNIVIVQVDSVAGPDTLLVTTPLCEGEQLQIVPVYTGTGNFNWTGPSGFNSTQQDIFIDSIRPNQSGYYTVTVNEGLCPSLPDSVNVIVYDSVPDYMLSVTSVCEGDTVTVNAIPSPVFTTTWTDPSGNTSSAAFLELLQYNSSQSGYYILHVENGSCPSYTDSIFLGAPSPGNVQISSLDTIACQGDSLIVIATHTNGVVSWNTPGSGDSIYIMNAGMVYCLLTDTIGCVFLSDTMNYYFMQPPVATVNDLTVCSGDDVQLTATVVPGSSQQVFYAWSGPASFASNQQAPVLTAVNQQQAGFYTLVAEDSICFAEPVMMQLTVNSSPAPPQITVSLPDCVGDTLELAALTTQGVSISYLQPGGMSYQGDTLLIFPTVLADTGLYICTATVVACPETSVNIEIDFDSCRVGSQDWIIPNIFSPNADNINDVFIPQYPAGEDGKLLVYNRWGDFIKECRITTGWDGRSEDGDELPAGVYFWVMNPDNPDSTLLQRKGFVELVR